MIDELIRYLLANRLAVVILSAMLVVAVASEGAVWNDRGAVELA